MDPWLGSAVSSLARIPARSDGSPSSRSRWHLLQIWHGGDDCFPCREEVYRSPPPPFLGIVGGQRMAAQAVGATMVCATVFCLDLG